MKKIKNAYTLAEVFHPVSRLCKNAYTLAEVFIVMLIIAVVAAISIKISKTKLDSIVSLTYYSAFSTMRTVSEQMLKDFRNIDDYVAGTDNQDAVTLPRSADSFCKLFVSYVNTKMSDEKNDACKGTSVDDTTEFNDATPDIILRNGMKIFNVTKGADDAIDVLDNNDEGIKFKRGESEVETDSNKAGYVVYVDLNGDKGNGELWDDVYKYYITLSGKVIPAYSAEGDGGNDRFYLQVSVKEENSEKWIEKSVSFKEAACSSGFINAATPYCTNSPAVSLAADCSGENNDCTLKYIMPVRF